MEYLIRGENITLRSRSRCSNVNNLISYIPEMCDWLVLNYSQTRTIPLLIRWTSSKCGLVRAVCHSFQRQYNKSPGAIWAVWTLIHADHCKEATFACICHTMSFSKQDHRTQYRALLPTKRAVAVTAHRLRTAIEWPSQEKRYSWDDCTDILFGILENIFRNSVYEKSFFSDIKVCFLL